MGTDLIKKYPNADLSKFDFKVDINQDGTVGSTAIYFKNSDVKSNTFLNDKSMTKQLDSKVRQYFPKNIENRWDSSGITKGYKTCGFLRKGILLR